MRVLVVDDEPDIRKVLTAQLKRANCPADTAASAEEALAMLESKAYDLILLDVELPGMTGFQALQAFAGRTKAPVVLMSGHADEEFAKDALLLGAKAMLRKPFDSEQLESLLRSLA